MKLNYIKNLAFPSLDDETGLVLAKILNIPSVHLPTVIPTVSAITPAPGKKDKPDRGKSGKASTKGNRRKLAPSPPDNVVQKEEQKVREETISNPKKENKNSKA